METVGDSGLEGRQHEMPAADKFDEGKQMTDWISTIIGMTVGLFGL